jgi:hypothetical protein
MRDRAAIKPFDEDGNIVCRLRIGLRERDEVTGVGIRLIRAVALVMADIIYLPMYLLSMSTGGTRRLGQYDSNFLAESNLYGSWSLLPFLVPDVSGSNNKGSSGLIHTPVSEGESIQRDYR